MALLVASSLGVFSCRRAPESYPLPAQRPSDYGPDPPVAVSDAVSMDLPWVQRYLVKDIDASPNQARRWTFREPEMRFLLQQKTSRKLVVNFIVHSRTFKETGPVTVSFLVNGRTVGTIRCTHPEEHRFEAPVPDELLQSTAETRVTITLDKYWVAPQDGAKLGVLLVDAGFFPR